MESIQIYLNSKNADKYNNGSSDCEYDLPLIEIPDGFHIYLSVVSCFKYHFLFIILIFLIIIYIIVLMVF